jgi:hypothetical protein
MAANQAPIYPLTPYVVSASLAAVTACTTRAPTATAALAAANIFLLVPAGASQSPVSTAGTRVDKIQVQAVSTSMTAPTAAQTVLIWEWDGTTAWVIDEIPVTVVTPSTTAAAFNTSRSYTNLVLPVAHALYVSTTITTTAATTALAVTVFAGTY